MDKTQSCPLQILSTQVLVMESPQSGSDEDVVSESEASQADTHSNISNLDTFSDRGDDVVKPVASARPNWAPPVPRLALQNVVGHPVLRGLSGSQTSRTHCEASKDVPYIKDNWRVREAEKVVGDVVVPEAHKGDASAVISSSSARRMRSNPCGQIFEELMALRSRNEQLSRQNAFLTRDLEERIAENEQLKTSLTRRNVDIEDLSRKLRAAIDANKQTTQGLLEARLALVECVADRDRETRDLSQQLRVASDKNEATHRELFEARMALVEYIESISSTQTSLNFENAALKEQNQGLLQEVTKLGEACCISETIFLDGQRNASCKSKPILLGRPGILSAVPFKKSSSECSWLRHKTPTPRETLTPLANSLKCSFEREAPDE